MTAVVALIALGFLLGVRHAADADHVLAVATLVTRERSFGRAAFAGTLWGAGHTLTILIAGGVILGLGLAVPESAGVALELLVAAMLIVLGVRNLLAREITAGDHAHGEATEHAHPHAHGDYVHSHRHGHGPGGHGHDSGRTPVARADRCFGGSALYGSLRPLLVGSVHGLAGSASIALVVVPVAGSAWLGAAWLVVFGVGTIAGMTLATAAMAVPLTRARRAGTRLAVARAAGAASLVFGAVLAASLL
ncbi:MAG TPA: high-affinity nickel-transport family protein [Thermoanaerobaculia bacterium]|nr:high-affinity nickel-transport family protein [Thermoanaerobaculia bacterium]